MRTVLYPGSFDPITTGHMDLIRRASARFDTVIVGVLHNSAKPGGAFPVSERLALIEAACEGLCNVRVQAFEGLLVEAVRACGADAVLRGLRTTADVDIELQMARINRQLADVETLFMAAAPEVVHVSASLVREVGRYGGNLAGLVPDTIITRVAQVLRGQG